MQIRSGSTGLAWRYALSFQPHAAAATRPAMQLIGDADILIAATAMENGMTLVTNN